MPGQHLDRGATSRLMSLGSRHSHHDESNYRHEGSNCQDEQGESCAQIRSQTPAKEARPQRTSAESPRDAPAADGEVFAFLK